MKTRKFLAALLVLCLMFSCMSVLALEEVSETIAVSDSRTVYVLANDGEYIDKYVYYSFTPAESGTYAFLLSYDESVDINHGSYVDVAGPYYNVDGGIMFEAEAGQEYELMFNYWGEYTEAMEYTLTLEKCSPLESIELAGDWEWGYVGESLFYNVIGEPAAYEPEEIIWEISDPDVAELGYVDNTYAQLNLLAPGAATLTATTASGLTASVEITVEEAPETLELTEGENPVTVPGADYVEFSFVPEQSGYYLITLDVDDAFVWMGAESVSDGINEYYILEAGETYYGDVNNWSEEDIDCNVIVEYAEDVVILEPVALEITKEPNNTTHLRENVDYLSEMDLLAGLELEVTWSDDSTSAWKYDEELGMIGNYFLYYELVETDSADTMEVVVYVDGTEIEPISWELTILDLTIDHLELVDPSPLQIVENSCGIDIGDFPVIMSVDEVSDWYYLPLAAYSREVVIVFSDDSTINAMPGEYVYGTQIYFEGNQFEHAWTKDRENRIAFFYGNHSVEIPVEIVDSPVESIELVTPPTNNTVMIDEDFNMVNADGEIVQTVRHLYEGMSLKVDYKDGTSKTFAEEDIEWVDVGGLEYPFVDGYPIGVLDGLLGVMQEEAIPPCEIEVAVEYMGVSATYTLSIVEEFPCEHEYEVIDSEESTCTDGGWSESVCTKCGETISADLPLADHEYADASCTEPKTCSVCGETEGEALGHSYTDGVCSICGEADPDYAAPTEPEATEPEATEPEATEPEATEPEATEPEATEPEATEPEATEPEATGPEATQPEEPAEPEENPETADFGVGIMLILMTTAALAVVVVKKSALCSAKR